MTIPHKTLTTHERQALAVHHQYKAARAHYWAVSCMRLGLLDAATFWQRWRKSYAEQARAFMGVDDHQMEHSG